MEQVVSFICDTIKSPYFLLIVLFASISIKCYFLSRLIFRISSERLTYYPLLFLFIYIASTIIGDFSWVVKLVQTSIISLPYYVVVFFIRGAWGFLIIQYYALSLFLESFTNVQFRFQKKHIPTSLLAVAVAGYFLCLMLFQPFAYITHAERTFAREQISTLEFFLMRYVVIGVIGVLIMVGLYRAYKNIQQKQLPKIVRKQLHLFMWFLIIPYLAVEFVFSFSFNVINDMQATVSILTLLLSIAVYYCLCKVLKLRFINTTSRVQEQPKPHILGHFKAALEQLSNTHSMEELLHITQSFFKETFFIPAQSVNLIIREHMQEDNHDILRKTKHIDLFVNQHISLNSEDAYQTIFVCDEIAFNHFYEERDHTKAILQFLATINADIFLPIISKKQYVGAIIIEKNSRLECFSHNEQDAMVAFASYLGNIINLLHNKNLDSLIAKKKKLKDQIYIKHQEINHYKESIQSFLRHAKEKIFGIIFYKNNRFTMGNRDATAIIRVDLNMQEGHPLTQAFKQVVYHVQTYNGPYNHYTYDINGLPLMLAGVPHLKQQSIIITASYPEISDVIMQQLYLLRNPTDWDYLLYLASTKTGALINEFIPSSGEILLNIKIELLKAALNKKTLLLDIAEADVPSVVQLMHQISQRETIHSIELTEPVKSPDMLALIFGNTVINPHREPLLKTLNSGTLFIKNVHFLDKTTQEYLTEYITHGTYRIYNTDQKLPSNARIITSTNPNMMHYVHEGAFSARLHNLLKQAMIKIPSLLTLPAQELRALIDSYSDKIIATHPMKNLFSLSEKEKQKIIEQPPTSLRELKMVIEQLILQKSSAVTINLYQDSLDTAYDTDVIEAARLGKKALKHPQLMKKLWQKFRNQNKIALFLGVNRSSVNRRCKLYDIGDESQGMA